MTKEDKLRIVARAFFTDNREDYEDYHEALTEMMTAGLSDQFIDHAVSPFLKVEENHTLLMRKDGHVAMVRDEDGFFSPVTEMTEDEGLEFEQDWASALEQYSDIEGIALLKELGWKVIGSKVRFAQDVTYPIEKTLQPIPVKGILGE